MAHKKTLISTLAALAITTGCSTVPPVTTDTGVFFDDFNYADSAALVQGGWTIRNKAGLPGMVTAHWGPDTIVVKNDPDQPGNRIVSMTASTDGTPDGTNQAQFCHARKYLEGTYAARMRFTDTPTGADGDALVQSFYVVSPLRFDYDPTYSELDWEYLPNGGWGDPKTRIYSTSWHTVRIEPWDSYNQHNEEFRSLEGWHTMVMQVADSKIKYFIDGVPFAVHGGRNYPVAAMSMNFNIWYIANGFAKDAKGPRAYHEDVDWVFHVKNRVWSPEEVNDAVKKYQAAKSPQVDTVPAMKPALASTCDF
jgi:hypothetical protein